MDIKALQEQTGLSESAVLLALDSILKELKKKEQSEKKNKVPAQHSEVEVYLTVLKRYICSHCGTQYVKQINLEQKESISCVDKYGRVKTLYALKKKSEAISIDCYTKVCHNCPKVISNMSRELLEQRYLELLTIIQNHNIEIRREVK